MFFEGSEKKVEIQWQKESLFSLPESFWREMVQASGAQILSSLQNRKLHAYLLSESSLFVWDDRLTMITCGQTQLINAIQFFVETQGRDFISSLIYERKNEYFPYFQKTHFFEDLSVLQRLIPGRALQFGQSDDHHLFLFHTQSPDFHPRMDDRTLEVLMYGLKPEVACLFSQPSTKEDIRQKLKPILESFELDDYFFDPSGYSLNALRGHEYLTIHVTPQEESPYISFECNALNHEDNSYWVRLLIQVFEPQSYDVIIFDPEQEVFLNAEPGYTQKDSVFDELKGAQYKVSYRHFFKANHEVQKAKEVRREFYE
ncbi:MAG: adenosylmethionine decarboxylase [Bdellovibrio sp.]|nr:MAG: adenosylmethionine decarboxylase [Bdellovibrio sp.]